MKISSSSQPTQSFLILSWMSYGQVQIQVDWAYIFLEMKLSKGIEFKMHLGIISHLCLPYKQQES